MKRSADRQRSAYVAESVIGIHRSGAAAGVATALLASTVNPSLTTPSWTASPSVSKTRCKPKHNCSVNYRHASTNAPFIQRAASNNGRPGPQKQDQGQSVPTGSDAETPRLPILRGLRPVEPPVTCELDLIEVVEFRRARQRGPLCASLIESRIRLKHW